MRSTDFEYKFLKPESIFHTAGQLSRDVKSRFGVTRRKTKSKNKKPL
jgi:hypothetical protein